MSQAGITLTRRGPGGAALALAGVQALPRRAGAAAAPVVIASDEGMTTLDPRLIRSNHPIDSIVRSLFDRLVRRRPDGSHGSRPMIGRDQPTPTSWRFHLRPGAVFHRGGTPDSEEVGEKLQRMHRSPFNGEGQLRQQAGLASATASGPLAVGRMTSGPSASMLYRLEEASVGAPRYRCETPADFDRHWNSTPSIRDVVFRTLPEPSSRVAELKEAWANYSRSAVQQGHRIAQDAHGPGGITRPPGSLINPPDQDKTVRPFAYDPPRGSALLRTAGAEGFALGFAFDTKCSDRRENRPSPPAKADTYGWQVAHWLQEVQQ